MSRRFDGSVNDFLDLSTLAVSVLPFTLSIWYKTPSLGQQTAIACLGTSGSNNGRRTLSFGASDKISASSRTAGGTSVAASTSLAITTNVWQVGTAVFTNDTLRDAYINGGNTGTNVTSNIPPVPNIVFVGGDPGVTTMVAGGTLLAHFAIWNIALQPADVALLYTGPPSVVQPANLVEYWPMNANQSPEPSFGTSPHSLTVHGTAFSLFDPFGNYFRMPYQRAQHFQL